MSELFWTHSCTQAVAEPDYQCDNLLPVLYVPVWNPGSAVLWGAEESLCQEWDQPQVMQAVVIGQGMNYNLNIL